MSHEIIIFSFFFWISSGRSGESSRRQFGQLAQYGTHVEWKISGRNALFFLNNISFSIFFFVDNII